MKKYKLFEGIVYNLGGSLFYKKEIEIDDRKRVAYISMYNPALALFEDELAKVADVKRLLQEIEEPELPKEFFCIDIDKVICYDYSFFSSSKNTRQEYTRFMEKYKSVGNYFETREEAEKYLGYLKAKEVIRKDTKGFKPDWTDEDEAKYWGRWDYYHNKPDEDYNYQHKKTTIYFKLKEDIKESFKNHPEEWKTYLTYEQ